MQLAGIDLTGTRVIEFNVFSAGGIYDANQFTGLDFTEEIIEGLQQT